MRVSNIDKLYMKGVIAMYSKNVGRLDAYVRISAGLMMVSLGVMKHKGWLVAIGSMKVAEGITRYCPILAICNCTTFTDEELLDEAFGCAIDCNCDSDKDHLEDDFEELEHACNCHHFDESEK